MIAVRFSEHQRYDITRDCDTRTMVATTPIGSYWAEIVDEGTAKYRESKERFKQSVVECIERDIAPREIDLA